MRSLAIGFALLLCGCTTTLSTYPVSKDQRAVAGIPYSLAALQYQVTVTRTLTGCATDAEGGAPEFGVKLETAPSYVAGETYVADYRTMSSGSKVTNVKIETYENQTIKAVNAEADDKGPEIVAGVAKAAFSVARLALGVPSVADVGGAAAKKPKCPAIVDSNRRLVAAQAEQAKTLSALNEQLEPYTTTALIGTLTEADKRTVSDLRARITKTSKSLTEIQKRLDELGKQLTFIEKLDLDFTSGGRDRAIPFPSADPAVKAMQTRWLQSLFGSLSDSDLGNSLPAMVATLRPLGAAAAADTQVCADAGVGNCLAPNPFWGDDYQSTPTFVPGIAFRQPVKARLRICETSNADLCAAAGTAVKIEAIANAPQLGMLVVLPFRNGFGANNQLQAQFRADGTMDWVSYAEKRATALASVNAANSVLSQGLAFSAALQTKRTADATAAKAKADAEAAAPLAAVKQQLDLAKAQKDLVDVQASLDPASIALKQQQAALDAKVAQLTAQVTIQDLEAKLKP